MAKQYWSEDTEIVAINVRLPKEVHEKLVLLAKRNYTSLNTEIIHIIIKAAEIRLKR